MASLERLRLTFTPSDKREFVPRDQLFPSFFVYSLLLLQKNRQFYASFNYRNRSGLVFICLFSFLGNSQLESDVSLLR